MAASFRLLIKVERVLSCCPGSHGSGSSLLPLGHPIRNQSQEMRKTAPLPAPQGVSPWTTPCPSACPARGHQSPQCHPLLHLMAGWLLESGPLRRWGVVHPERGLQSTGDVETQGDSDRNPQSVPLTPPPAPRGTAPHRWEEPLLATSLPTQGQVMLTAKPLLGLNPGRAQVACVSSELARIPACLLHSGKN